MKLNPVAKKLSDPRFKPLTVKVKKGKGSYKRKEKTLGKQVRSYDETFSVATVLKETFFSDKK